MDWMVEHQADDLVRNAFFANLTNRTIKFYYNDDVSFHCYSMCGIVAAAVALRWWIEMAKEKQKKKNNNEELNKQMKNNNSSLMMYIVITTKWVWFGATYA